MKPNDASGEKKAPARPVMDRRSWYMPRETADAVAALVDDLHYSMRLPKHAVLDALAKTALAHRDEVEARLRD